MPAAYEGLGGGAPLSPAGLDQWWRLFGDPGLDALEEEALKAGPDARTAAARVIEARETRRAQTAQTLPSGSISGTASREKAYDLNGGSDNLNPVGGVTDSLGANFNVSWELDLFGRLATARRIAAADAAQARFDTEGTRASLAAAVADAYFQAKGLIIQLADANETARIASDLADIARRRAAAGTAPPDEVDRVTADLLRAQARADDLEAQLHGEKRQLLILLGRGLAPAADLPLVGDPPEAPAPPRVLPTELLARRPDVREAEFRLRSEIGIARLRHLAVWPTITLLPGLGVSRTVSPGVSYIPPSTLISAPQTTSSGFWSLAAGVSAPTLDIPKLLYQARAEDARARQAAIAYEKSVQTAFGEAQTALTDLAAGQVATTRLAQGESAAERAYQASRRRYARGLDDLTTTLQAEQGWRAARTALTSERVDTLRRAVRTYKALGGGWAFTPATGG